MALVLAVLLMTPAIIGRRLSRERTLTVIGVRNVMLVAGIALLLGLAVGDPGDAKFWIVFGAVAVVLIPYLAALNWCVRHR